MSDVKVYFSNPISLFEKLVVELERVSTCNSTCTHMTAIIAGLYVSEESARKTV